MELLKERIIYNDFEFKRVCYYSLNKKDIRDYMEYSSKCGIMIYKI